MILPVLGLYGALIQVIAAVTAMGNYDIYW